MTITNLQIAMWLTTAEKTLNRQYNTTTNPLIKNILKTELNEIGQYINDLKLVPNMPHEPEIKKKGA